jgi:hypothetical protein
MSAGWVFPDWVGSSRWFKKEFGVYPPRETLVELGKMTGEEPEEHAWFVLYLWERNRRKGRTWMV